MSRYRIVESLGSSLQNIHTYEDLEIHHPSKRGREAGRIYSNVDGEREEVLRTRSSSGQLMVSKDFILLDQRTGLSRVPVPAPVSGFITMNRSDGLLRIYDRPGGELLAQVRHMDLRGSSLKDRDYICYGQPMGLQGGFNNGNPNAFGTHVHVDVNARYLDQFKQYIRDVDTGVITTDRHPAQQDDRTTPAPRPAVTTLSDGVLRQSEQGAEVTKLQERLNALGYRDAQGRSLETDGDFGLRTKQAVQSLQRARGLDDDGIVGRLTMGALRTAPLNRQDAALKQSTPQPSPQPANGRTALSDLIGRGEGGYNSFNRGRAGDSGGSEIDFSQMTLSEIMRRQDLPRNDPNRLFAVGKFQMIPGTMEETVNAMRLDCNLRFTPELQEWMFADYLIDEKRPAVHTYVTGQTSGSDGLRQAQIGLAQEFASVADPRTGRSVYDGDSGGNSASITAREVETVLNLMRTQYRSNIEQGMTPTAAYQALRNQRQGGVPDTQDGITPGQNPQVQLQPNTSSTSFSNGIYRQGEKGEDIRGFQTNLNRLGYRDANGIVLVEDGKFGLRTKQAVEAYQRKNGLEVDGIVGPHTLESIGKRSPGEWKVTASGETVPGMTSWRQISLLSDTSHPDHALYKQAQTGIQKLPPSSFRNDQERHNAAATVAFESKVSGLRQIDHVVLSTNGTGLFAIQGRLDDPAHHRVQVDKVQAASQPIEKSTQQIDQESRNPLQQGQVTLERDQKRAMLG